VLQIAGAGLNAVRQQQTLLHGLNTYQGYLTCQGVAESFALPYTKPEELLAA
jgi:alanine dehydrogenase